MSVNRIVVRGGLAFVLVGALQAASPWPLAPGLATPAHAVVGRPATPASVAGVARRTARRTTAVVASSSTAAASSASASAAAAQQQAAISQQQAAAAQQQAAAAQQQAARAEAEAAAARQEAAAAQQAPKTAALPVGTTISALPSGCSTLNMGGTDYFNCGGMYLRPAFQSGNIVYVVSQP